MRAAVVAVVAAGLLGLAGTGRAADESKELIVGTWEITHSDGQDSIPVGTRLEFTADGKVNLTAKGKDGKDRTDPIGGYKIDKEFVVLTGPDGKKNDKGRVCLLNKTSFVLYDETEDKVLVLKRMKLK